MRSRACPDLGEPKREGFHNVVPGSDYEFPDCPLAYLRTAGDVQQLRDMGREPVAHHLVDDAIHLAGTIGDTVYALDAGALNVKQLSPKERALASLYISERDKAREYQSEQRRKDRDGAR